MHFILRDLRIVDYFERTAITDSALHIPATGPAYGWPFIQADKKAAEAASDRSVFSRLSGAVLPPIGHKSFLIGFDLCAIIIFYAHPDDFCP